MLQARRVDNLKRIKPLNGGQCPEVRQSFDDLAKEDLSIGCVVYGYSYLVGAIFNDADDMFLDVLLPSCGFDHAVLVDRPICLVQVPFVPSIFCEEVVDAHTIHRTSGFRDE